MSEMSVVIPNSVMQTWQLIVIYGYPWTWMGKAILFIPYYLRLDDSVQENNSYMYAAMLVIFRLEY